MGRGVAVVHGRMGIGDGNLVLLVLRLVRGQGRLGRGRVNLDSMAGGAGQEASRSDGLLRGFRFFIDNYQLQLPETQ